MERKRSIKNRQITAAESYGWVVESWEADEAYEMACEYFGEDDINAQIVRSLGSDELAECLAYIFRMNDFTEWDERNSDEDEDEYWDDEEDEDEEDEEEE